MSNLASQAEFAALLRAATPQALPRGFAVYRGNRRAALHDSLAATYSVVQRILGEACFAQTAASFVADAPPRHPVLHEYGAGFADFLAAQHPELPYLADVARLEWAWLCAYHAEDAVPLRAEALAGMDDAALLDARFLLHPSLQLIRSAFPIATIWEMHQDGAEPQPVASWCAEDVLVLRPQLNVTLIRVAPGFSAFIAALMRGAALGDAIHAAVTAEPDFAPAAALAAAFQAGAIAAIGE